MKLLSRAILVLICTATMVARDSVASETPMLQKYIASRIEEFKQIDPQRREQLAAIAEFVRERVAAKEEIRLTFICTHNSRRSHMAQLWSAAAAEHYGVENYQSYSGGTEATAFNPRAVAALERAGMQFEIAEIQNNPKYSVTLQEGIEPQLCFSKVYNRQPNPEKSFCAVMVCSDADENCPVVSGAIARFAIPYEDPKVADGTPGEAAKYDERSAQIAREMLFLFSLVSTGEE